MQPNFQHIPLHQLVLSSTTAQKERRAHFDKVALKELAESIRTAGMLQPIVARPITVPDSPNLQTFEIVAGERRFLAADMAKLEAVPVNIRNLNDDQVLEIQLVENLQRQDVHPMAEAEGYEGLRKLGRSADEIAERVGKSKGYVYGRMKLLDLCKAARKAFYAAKISASTALDLARIPVPALQEQALEEIANPRYRDDPLSVREARDHIQRHYMLRLASAGFPTEDASLVAAAGPCGSCPKRTGNQPQLFGDVKHADVCTDPVCFKSKVLAHGTVAVAKAKELGQTVIVGEEAVKKIAPWGVNSSYPDHVRLDEATWEHGEKKTYREVLGKDYLPMLLQNPETGVLIEIAPKKDIPRPKTKGSTGGSSSGSSRSGSSKTSEKAQREFESMYRLELYKRVYSAAPATPSRDLLVMSCIGAVNSAHHTSALKVAIACGLPFTEKASLYEEKAYSTLKDTELARLALVLNLQANSPDDGYGSAAELEKVAKSLKIDLKRVRADLKAALKTPPATKASAEKKKQPAKKKAAAKKGSGKAKAKK